MYNCGKIFKHHFPLIRPKWDSFLKFVHYYTNKEISFYGSQRKNIHPPHLPAS